MSVTTRRAGVAALALGALVVAGGVVAGVAYASSTYVVDNTVPSCSDTGPGTSPQPFCTIGAGAKKALAGDTVLVNAGTYVGTSVNPTNSGSFGSPITFTANPGVTISGGTRGFGLSNRSFIVVSGFTITGTSSYGISVSGGSNDVISGNTVSFAGLPIRGSSAAGIYLSGLTGGVVSGNVSHDNSAHGIFLTGATTGVTVQGNTSYHNAYQYQRNANGIDDVAPGNFILNNITYANEDTGINMYTGGDNAVVAGNLTYGNGDHGIDDYNVTGGRITGNTVYFNCTDGINVEGTSGNYVIEDNVSENNATGAVINPTLINPPGSYTNKCNRRTGNIGVYDSAPATTTADYNVVWQTGSGPEYVWAGTAYNTQAALHAASGQETHGIFADPRFANPAGLVFQLTAGSPAIDSADSDAVGGQATDILGNPRVDDPSMPNTGTGPRPYDDRGAYEFQPNGAPVAPTAHLSVTPGTGMAPLTVSADASASTAGSSPIATYTFDFGDGTTAGPQAGATASHTYQAAGSYTATVTATDGNALTSTASQAVTVTTQAPIGPAAHLSVTPGTGMAPLTVSADASASTAGSSPIATYTFDFGDGTTAGPQAGATASHTYQAAGSYTATVTATDGNALTSTASQAVTVNAGGTTAQYINQIATNYSTSTHTSGYVTVWRTGGVGAGDLIIAVVQLTGTTSAGAVSGSDSAGDTLTVASDTSDGAGDRLVTLSGVARTGLAVAAQITITFPSATSYRITADEVAGVSAADRMSAAGGSAGAFSSGATATTSRPGEFVFGATATFGGTSLTWSPGWTNIGSYTAGANALVRADQIPATTGSFAATGTCTGSWLAEVVTFM
jgi:parallel beta-helix repeat protein